MIRYQVVAAIVACLLIGPFAVSAEPTAVELVHDVVQLIGTAELTESSGMAFSTRDPNCIWTHNDSGGDPKLYAFDIATGGLTGECRLTGAAAMDWESLTTAGADGHELIVADSGDNLGQRKNITLYRFREPDPHRVTELAAGDYKTLNVRYPDGAADCEAVWYDTSESSLMFMTKGRRIFASVYRVSDQQWSSELAPTPAPENPASGGDELVVTATKIATLPLPMATGADRDPATGDLWVAGYFQAFCFRRGEHAELQSQLADVPIAVEMPRWRQIEAIAVDGKSQVWITSEGNPAKLGRLN